MRQKPCAKHRWFSGKISRCHLFQINSASPGFDSRPMQLPFCLSIKLFGHVLVEILRFEVVVVRAKRDGGARPSFLRRCGAWNIIKQSKNIMTMSRTRAATLLLLFILSLLYVGHCKTSASYFVILGAYVCQSP
jgi:hypothetical protein